MKKQKLLRISAEYHTLSNTWHNVRIAGKFVSNTDENMIVNMLHQLTSASRYNRFLWTKKGMNIMLKRQKINQVLKIIMETGQWHGYIVACKVNEWHINHGWYLGYPVDFTIDGLIKEYDDEPYCMSESYPPTNDVMSKVVKMVTEKRQNYEWYNCNYELGYYAVFYQEVN